MATNLQSYNQQCQSNMVRFPETAFAIKKVHNIPGKITENQYKL